MNTTRRALRAGASMILFGAVTASFALPLPAFAQTAPSMTCRSALEGADVTQVDITATTSCCYITSEDAWYKDNGIAEDVTYRSGSRYVETQACTGSIAAGFGSKSLTDDVEDETPPVMEAAPPAPEPEPELPEVLDVS